MKGIKILTLAALVLVITSCANAGEKAAGTYNGNFNISGTNYPGKIVVTKVSETKVDMALTCYAPALNDNADGVTVSNDGNSVVFGYSTSTSAAYDMASINGALNGSTVVLDGIICLGGNNYGYGVFTGTK